MNTNLRAMIDDALDGAYADEQAYGYADYSDVPVMISGSDDAVKIASALNHVASHLNDLGTTEEKIAELELFSELLKEASGETAAKDTAEAAKDTLGHFYDNLKGNSGVSISDAFGKLSTGRKFAVGGAAGLVGLGALYGGAKMIGGSDSPNNNIVKVGGLADARMRGIAKIAQRYDIPVWELEKLALDKAQAGITAPRDLSAIGEVTLPENATKAQADAFKGYQQQIAQRQAGAKKLLGDSGGGKLSDASKATIEAYGKGEAVSAAQMEAIRADLAANPTSSNAFQAGSRIQDIKQRGPGSTRNLGTTTYVQGPQKTVERTLSDGSKVRVPAVHEKTPLAKIEGNLAKYTVAPVAEGDALARERINIADELDRGRSARGPNPARAKGTSTNPTARIVQREAAGAARARNITAATDLNMLVSSATRDVPNGNMVAAKLKAAIKAEAKGTATPADIAFRRSFIGDEAMTQARAVSTASAERAASQQTGRGRRGKMSRRGQARRAAGIQSGAIKPSAAEAASGAAAKTEATELGFLAKNRRGLLAAGGIGAAGLAGYGLYRAMGGGQSKAASYMSKVAEDRINPARIRAGASDPFSGFDIRSRGGAASHFNPVALRAQQVRSRINSDMHGYVSNVGGGYNLERYLNRFNN